MKFLGVLDTFLAAKIQPDPDTMAEGSGSRQKMPEELKEFEEMMEKIETMGDPMGGVGSEGLSPEEMVPGTKTDTRKRK